MLRMHKERTKFSSWSVHTVNTSITFAGHSWWRGMPTFEDAMSVCAQNYLESERGWLEGVCGFLSLLCNGTTIKCSTACSSNAQTSLLQARDSAKQKITGQRCTSHPCFCLSKPYSFLMTSGLCVYWGRIIVIIWIINSESWVITNYDEIVNRKVLQYYFYGNWEGLYKWKHLRRKHR